MFFSEPGSVGLIIDKLISTQFGYQAVSQWIAKGGSQHYPPSTIHVCMKCFITCFRTEKEPYLTVRIQIPNEHSNNSEQHLLVHCTL